MTNQLLYLAIGIPLLFNATLIGLLVALMNSKFSAMEAKFEARFSAIDARFKGIDAKFEAVYARLEAIEKRFDDMRNLWRAELRRVEELLDVRLRQLESR